MGSGTCTVLGGYTLGKVLGEGGMSTVFAGHHPEHGSVAIKVIRKDLIDQGETHLEVRLAEEARILQKLRGHPNVVRHVADGWSEGRFYLVTERLKGESMAEQAAPLPQRETLLIGIRLCQALVTMRRHRIVHRDLKPGNILVSPRLLGKRAWVKIIDFGLARDMCRTGRRLTVPGNVFGTAEYASPEQSKDTRQAEMPSDVFSLGCTLYSVLTNTDLFPCPSTGDYEPARKSRPLPHRPPDPNISAPVWRVLQAMVNPAPDQRPTPTACRNMLSACLTLSP